jgi:hypothetical protein
VPRSAEKNSDRKYNPLFFRTALAATATGWSPLGVLTMDQSARVGEEMPTADEATQYLERQTERPRRLVAHLNAFRRMPVQGLAVAQVLTCWPASTRRFSSR